MLNGILIGLTALILATIVAVMLVRHANRLGNGEDERKASQELYSRLFDQLDVRDVERPYSKSSRQHNWQETP